jgi:hypothetical protein
VTVLQRELKSVEFISDHGLLTDNNSDWTDNGTTYASPEWVRSPARNNPISQTKNTTVTVVVTVAVTPAGVTFDLVGDGGVNYLNFSRTGITSTGGDQQITNTASAALPHYVTNISKGITWTITTSGTACQTNTWNSGPHTIYVTYGTPAGSVVTEKRVSFVCNAATGKSGLEECADAVFGSLSGSYNLGASMWGPDPVWLLHDSGQSSQCPGLAKYVNVHFQMLGLGAGAIKFCHANADGTYSASDDPDGGVSRSCTSGNNGHTNNTHAVYNTAESLVHWDGSTPPGPNRYEATCFFNSYHYALPSCKKSTAKEVVRWAFGNPPNIRWEYVDLDNPGPPPTYKWAHCDVNPWAEAP